MAANVVHNAVLQDVLGFAVGLRAAIIAQGADDLESLGPLEDKEIDTIADNVRRGVRPDASGQGGVPGFDIDCIQTWQLKKAAYTERHLRSRMSSPQGKFGSEVRKTSLLLAACSSLFAFVPFVGARQCAVARFDLQ